MSVTATAEPPRRHRLPRLGNALAAYGGFLPTIVLLGLFFLVPLGIIVCYSFWETINYSTVHHWTTGNYRYFFSVDKKKTLDPENPNSDRGASLLTIP